MKTVDPESYSDANMDRTPNREDGAMTDHETPKDDEADKDEQGSANTPPAAPEPDDDSPAGDTDQHSDANA